MAKEQPSFWDNISGGFTEWTQPINPEFDKAREELTNLRKGETLENLAVAPYLLVRGSLETDLEELVELGAISNEARIGYLNKFDEGWEKNRKRISPEALEKELKEVEEFVSGIEGLPEVQKEIQKLKKGKASSKWREKLEKWVGGKKTLAAIITALKLDKWLGNDKEDKNETAVAQNTQTPSTNTSAGQSSESSDSQGNDNESDNRPPKPPEAKPDEPKEIQIEGGLMVASPNKRVTTPAEAKKLAEVSLKNTGRGMEDALKQARNTNLAGQEKVFATFSAKDVANPDKAIKDLMAASSFISTTKILNIEVATVPRNTKEATKINAWLKGSDKPANIKVIDTLG